MKIAELNSREVFFFPFVTTKNWVAGFPEKNWCLVILADKKNRNYFDEIINKSIDRNVGYISAVGEQHDFIHDLADEELVFREVDIEDHYLPKHLIMTVGDYDLANGIWFGIFASQNPDTKIETVVILDVDNNKEDLVTNLVNAFEDGFIPE